MSSRISIFSWAAFGGGRGKALLSLSNYLSENGFEVNVLLGRGGWLPDILFDHHGIRPDADFSIVDWEDDKLGVTHDHIESENPDVVVGFDSHFEGTLDHITKDWSIPTVNWLRRGHRDGEYDVWTVNPRLAEEYGHDLVFPVWYIEEASFDEGSERPIDLISHTRKVNRKRQVSEILNGHNVLFASHMPYRTLRECFLQSKAFFFDEKDRYEPLGLMPIEAASCGCKLILPENSGVGEIYPDFAFDRPIDYIDDVLEADVDLPLEIPESPTDPVKRLSQIAV